MGGNKTKKRRMQRTGSSQSSSTWMLCSSHPQKKSVTAKTMESMTEVEKKGIIRNAGKSLLKQAKKGFQAETMKVCSCVLCCSGAQTLKLFMSF